MATTLKNETCEITIERNPWHRPERANQYYRVTLVSGEWPKALHVICDNRSFDGGNSTFGGDTKIAGNVADVTVYVD